MKGLKQFGAMALAAALTITLAAPIGANAAIITNYDANGKVVSYTNEDTGKTGKRRAEVETEIKTLTIATNDYTATKDFSTTVDVAKFTNFKSNKKGLKVKVISSEEYTDPDPAAEKGHAFDWYDDGKYYYKDVNGDIKSVDSYDKCPLGYDEGTYTVRFFAKKAGTYKLKYNAVLKDGSTVKKTLKVIAKADGEAIQSVTFAGKVIAESAGVEKQTDNWLWERHYGYVSTTAKSGKIRVTMNKDFKLKKIEVGTPIYTEVAGTAEDYWTKYYKDATYASSLDRYADMTMSWKKVKNGKKIKLNKDDSYVHAYFKNTTYRDKDTRTPTYVRITYYDKKNKTTERTVITINKINK